MRASVIFLKFYFLINFKSFPPVFPLVTLSHVAKGTWNANLSGRDLNREAVRYLISALAEGGGHVKLHCGTEPEFHTG